jgi:hypothetical protein
MSKPEIRFVANRDIDREKWDKCIAHSPFGIAYAYSWYLDRICDNWDALISGDYLYIMPLPSKYKFGISYIYQPFFTQQLGIFSTIPCEEALIGQFLNAIPSKFKLVNLNLNLGNSIPETAFNFRKNTTYHLSLNSRLDEIQSAYNTNTKRNIQKAIQNKLSVIISSDINRFIEFTKTNLQTKAPEVKNHHYSVFQDIIRFALRNKLGEIDLVVNEKNDWLSAVFFLKTNQTCIYLAASSNSEGIEKSAMFLLIDNFIRRNAGSKLTLDFEGSNIQGVARFYAGFGASPQTYLSVHINSLPWVLRLLKK